ncbi:MAG TPA: extracellular solute-binding protein [Pseudolabrys sp.]|nr:extracellular solute-binding protein [Pseudolabrys sp.]
MASISAVALLSVIACGTADAASSRDKFPKELQPLLEGASDALTDALWELRQGPSGTVVWKDGGGALGEAERKAYWDGFEKLTNWKVQNVAPSANPPDVEAQVQSGDPQFDVFETKSGANAMLEQQQNLLEPLDPKLFGPIFAKFPKGYLHSTHWLEYTKSTGILIWNTKRWPKSGKHPTDITDLFNTKDFPGKRCLYKFLNATGTLEYPLLADGVPKDKLWPLDVNRALKKLDTIRNDIVWWTGGAQSVQLVLDGECDMGVTWHGRAANLFKQDPNTPLGVVWKNAEVGNAPFAIVKGTKRAKAAQAALAYAYTPKNMCTLLNTLGYGVPIDESCLTDFAKTWAVTADKIPLILPVDNDWYLKHYATATDQFNAWLQK